MLTSTVSDKEIKDVIFSMNSFKSPGPDGMNSLFFKVAWDFIEPDVSKAVKHIFASRKILGGVNATHICLIPKTHHPVRVDEFRPIACCNVLYKVISKIIANRIRLVIFDVVSPSQNAFIPERHIQDNLLLAHEIIRETIENMEQGSVH